MQLNHIVVGTSGHVDHGKSTLVQALTGVDPDRFAEEKKRGITIDLGFAHYIWQDELEVSFVDVPGHERFIHNMLAGVGGIQLLLLVVAADDGVMPQTREHLHICNLLGVRRGLVVITRCDLVDEEMIELVTEEVTELVEGTFLEEQPIMPVSSITGSGLPELQQTIADVAKQVENDKKGVFRLPIDRRFTVKGFGTVVTGTVLSGQAELQDEFVLYPQKVPVRVRGFQVHGKEAERLQTGQRSAINLVGISKEEISRGNQLSFPDRLVRTHVIDVEIRAVPNKSSSIKNRSKIKFYCNAQELVAKIIFAGPSNGDSKESKFAQIRFKEPLSCRYGDRFILRTLSPIETVGGGRIIAPIGNRSRKNRDRLLESLEGLAAQDELIRIRETVFLAGPGGVHATGLSPLVDCSAKVIQKHLKKLSSNNEIILVNAEQKRYVHRFHCERIVGFFVRSLNIYHKRFPEKLGASGSDFFGKMSRMFQPREILTLLNWAVKAKQINREDDRYRLPSFKGGLNKAQKALKSRVIEFLQKQGFHPPGLVNMANELAVDRNELKKLLRIGHTEKWIVQIKDDIWFHPDFLEQAKQELYAAFKEKEELTVIEFKDRLHVSRKHAIGILEYFDGLHITRRQENHRVLHHSESDTG